MILNLCCTAMLLDTGGGGRWQWRTATSLFLDFCFYFILYHFCRIIKQPRVWKDQSYVSRTLFLIFFMQRVMNAEWCLYFYGRACDLKIHV